jgi:small conductance mechanosensitive channel
MNLANEMGAYGPKILGMATAFLGAAALFAAFYIGANIARRVINHLAQRDRERQDVLQLVGNGVRVAILAFGGISALGTLGVDVSAIIAGLGLTGFALGFALKDMLSSAVAGLMILLARPFKNGQRVQIAAFEGEVVAIDLRYTTLADGDKRYLVPNATVLASPVVVLPAKTA